MARRQIRALSSGQRQHFLQFLAENPDSSFTAIQKHFKEEMTRYQVNDVLLILFNGDEISIITKQIGKNKQLVYNVVEKGGERHVLEQENSRREKN